MRGEKKMNELKNKLEEVVNQSLKLSRKGQSEEGLRLLADFAEEIKSLPEKEIRPLMGTICHTEGRVLQSMGKYHSAVSKLQEAIELRKDDPIQRAYSMFQLFICKTYGKILITDKEIAETKKALWRVINASGDLKEVGDAYHNLGFIHAEDGDMIGAIQYSLRALGFKKEAKDERGIALIWARLGEYYRKIGDNQKVYEYYGKKALKYFEETEDIERIRQIKENVFGEK